MSNIYFPAEWAENCTIQLTWPHMDTDWAPMIEDAQKCFTAIAGEILKRQDLLIVCPDKELLLYELKDKLRNTKGRLLIREIKSNDTWARDHGAITVIKDGKPLLYDFTFNGWGMKFAADKDNLINRELLKQRTFEDETKLVNMKHFVLEGGSVESDGKGTLLTTSNCLLSPNRNSHLSKNEIENYLKEIFGCKRILWLNHGYMAGDDTDSHIDTLARFCDEHTIAYVQCTNTADEHFEELNLMEQELKAFVDNEGNPYQLIPLPMCSPVKDSDNERLPATYANFLILDNVVLLPTYQSPETDTVAIEQLKKAFPNRDIIPVDCTTLIYQHGALHCVTMQYPHGVIKMK